MHVLRLLVWVVAGLGKLTDVHFFQRQAFCLFDEEPCVQHQRPVEAAEHEKGFPSEIVDGGGRHLGQREAKQPLRCGADGDASFADSCREDFAHIQLHL